MFVRTADIKINAWYDESNIFDLKRDWHKVVHSDHICKDGTCPFVKEAAFDYDPDAFLYYRARAITGSKKNDMHVNGNGDAFFDEEIAKAWKTFIGRGVFKDHDNDDPIKAFGLILDAAWHTNISPAYVEILCALDKETTEQKHPGMLRQIKNGIVNSTSMSCLTALAECSVCGNQASTEEQLCKHMLPSTKERYNPHYIKGRMHNGSLAFEINYALTFTEDSIVGLGADKTAHIIECWASLKKASDVEEVRACLARLNELLSNLEN